MRRAVRDAGLAAVVTSATPLRYDAGADDALDRPAHVRAASGLAPTRDGFALVQDDANFIALVSRDPTRVRAITLPSGEGGKRQFDTTRGNKKHKLDLEACFAVDEPDGTLLVAMGSGSRGHGAREHVVLVRRCEVPSPEVTLVHAPRLYERLRAAGEFAGSEMNVEGAVHLGDRVRLFGRGNGAARDGVRPVNATCDLDWNGLLAHLRDPGRVAPPEPLRVVGYELDSLGEVPLGFTDAAAWHDGILYSAAAEDSPNVIDDGPVHGSAIGVIDASGAARWTPLTEPTGALFPGKVEGILGMPDESILAVVDADDPATASLLCTIELRGSGWG